MSKECYYCGCQLNDDAGHLRFDDIKVGKMGGSITLRGGGSATASRSPSRRGVGGISYNTGRNMYKRLRIWACDECNARKVLIKKIKIGVILFSIVISAVFLFKVMTPLWKVPSVNQLIGNVIK